MKKSSKILGSIALSAALVMGTAAPAFADTADNETELRNSLNVAMEDGTGINVNAGEAALTSSNAQGASTLVNVGTYTSQINVAIPISLPLYFDTVGGPGIAPADGKYKIENKSTADITVKSAAYAIATGKESAWKFGGAKYTAGSTSAKVSGSGNMGDIFVSIAPLAADGTADTTKALELKSTATSGAPSTSGTAATLGWAVPGNQTISFHVDPSSTQLGASLTDFEPVATITYTVGVGTSGQAPVGPVEITVNDNTKIADIISNAGSYITKANLEKVLKAVAPGTSTVTYYSAYTDATDNTPLTVADGAKVEVTKVIRTISGTDVNLTSSSDPVENGTYKVVCSIHTETTPETTTGA